MRYLLIFAFYALLSVLPATAQLGLGLAISIDDETIRDGWYSVHVRYYTVSTDGTAVAEEVLSGRFVSGRCSLLCGLTTQIPDVFLQSASASIGYSIAGEPERLPRIRPSRVPYAEHALHAQTAEALSPSFTGLVTSINELAGPVTLVGEDGIRVQRQGSTLTIGQQRSPATKGIIRGNNVSHQFAISPGRAITSDTRVTLQLLNSTTQIALTSRVNLTDGTILIVAAAPLLDTELISWEITE
jgi:hypothetical protein